MKLKFDPNQSYQREAIDSVVRLFEGQPLSQTDYEISFQTKWDALVQTELGVGNQLLLNEETLLKNLQAIQDDNDIERVPSLVDSWPLGATFPATFPITFPHSIYHFSVEMETGTGKTYVYLRTIFELNRKYGFKKFIIVVPSLAIREGVLKNLEITKEHFRSLYNNVPYEYFVYDSGKVNQLRQFATSNQLQIQVINIDAFNKKQIAVMYKEHDKLSGRQPIEYIQATRPIVIIDEPQSVDNTEKAKEAIKNLHPLCTLRYSATHKNPYNLVYRLDPVQAFKDRLVKQIVVADTKSTNAYNQAFVKCAFIGYKKGSRTPTAKVKIIINTKNEAKEKEIPIKQGTDLYVASNNREQYSNNFVVTEIRAEEGNKYIEFSNDLRLEEGQEVGGLSDDIVKVQIRQTIQRHLDKEKQLKDTGIKVLSLFFIDKVKHYREYDEQGAPRKGKFAMWFEESYQELIKLERYQELIPWKVEKLHDGYFAQDKKGVFKDTRGDSQDDETAYDKILKNKEQLLSTDEPLRFIFSHSALSEGWDNPNVFQICTLTHTQSALTKRQKIGRGLRLPVNQNGDRVFDDNVNKLLVIANESYESFARGLQNEYEDDCGVTFGKIPQTAFSRLVSKVDEHGALIGRESSVQIWSKLKELGVIDDKGRIQPSFDPRKASTELDFGKEFEAYKSDIVSIVEGYQIEKHVKKADEQVKLKLNKQVFLDTEFQELWNRIKHRTAYSVNFETAELISKASKAIGAMSEIESVKVIYREAAMTVREKGVGTMELANKIMDVQFGGDLPDIIAYLQKQTELTRSTIVQILVQSGRLKDFVLNPQKFMDEVTKIIRRELNRLIIDGIKYEKIQSDEYSMMLFQNEEIYGYLSSLVQVKPDKSIYDAVPFDSEVERKFAEKMNERTDIKLFVKLPRWFKVPTPLGSYNPDWAIVKQEDTTIYLVRETKGSKDFKNLRNTEADKIKCGKRHFKELDISYAVVTNASEV